MAPRGEPSRRSARPVYRALLTTHLVVRRHAAELGELAAHHGIHDLRFASAGRLLGRVDPDRDMLDMAAFAADAEDLLGAPVSLLSDAVLGKANVSLDLVQATAL